MSTSRPAMKRILLATVIIMATVGSAYAVIHPLLSNGPFLYTGWVFGVSVFGTGNFG